MMDICPTHYMYKTADRQFASAYFHWFFLILPAPFPETLIGNNVDPVLKLFMGSAMPKFIEPDAYAEYRRCFSNPAAIHASCEDYRAAATIDLAHDEADMDRKIHNSDLRRCRLSHRCWRHSGHRTRLIAARFMVQRYQLYPQPLFVASTFFVGLVPDAEGEQALQLLPVHSAWRL